MIRILHLLEHQADFETRRGVESLCRALGDGFAPDFRTIGAGGGDWRDAPTAAARLRQERNRFDLVHAWGGRALTVAAFGSTLPIVFSPLPQMGRRSVPWLRAVSSYRRVEAIAPTSTLRRRMVEGGVQLERCHLIRPGVELARLKRRKDSTLREQLGLSDDDYVLLAPGESTRASNHELALWTASILHVHDPRYKLLVWGRGPTAHRVQNLARKVGPLASVRSAEPQLGRAVEFEELCAAADAALVTAVGPVATLPIAICMAAAMAIVATTSYTVGELLEDRHTALMTGSKAQRELARRVLDLRADSNQQWAISDMARTEAYEFFAFTRFVNQFRTIYRQVAARENVQVPEQGPGAGLRFHGRA